SGKVFVAPDLFERLNSFGPPAFYLDFEAFAPSVPLYPGTRPFQTVPFQWSLHQINADGSVSHQEFLSEADTDPRRPFARTLIEALSTTNLPIIVYSSYEQARLRELSATFWDLRKPIANILQRLTDLLPLVRGCVYHPNFGFSYSIKATAPALCP